VVRRPLHYLNIIGVFMTTDRCEEKGVCCLYNNSHSSLSFYEAGQFLGCSHPITSVECTQSIANLIVPTKRVVFVPDAECGPNNSGINDEVVICPDSEKGSWFAKQNKTLGVYGKAESFTYDCECQVGTKSEFNGRKEWVQSQPNPSEWVIIEDSWSTEPCSTRTLDCNQGPMGSFCTIESCISSTQEEFDNALAWSEANTNLHVSVVADTWENKDCSERTKKCYATDACEVKTENGDPDEDLNVKTLKDCTCDSAPHPLRTDLNAFPDALSTDKARKIVTNAKEIHIIDGLDKSNNPTPIVDSFEIDECGRAYLCQGDTIYKGATSVPYYLPGPSIPIEVKDNLPQPSRVLAGYVYITKCEQQGTQLVRCGQKSFANNIVVPNSTEEGCIDSFSTPVKNAAGVVINSTQNNVKVVCGPCETDPPMSWIASSPYHCGTLTISACGSYTKKEDNVTTTYFVYPHLYSIRVYIDGWFNNYTPHIFYSINGLSVAMNDKPPGCP